MASQEHIKNIKTNMIKNKSVQKTAEVVKSCIRDTLINESLTPVINSVNLKEITKRARN